MPRPVPANVQQGVVPRSLVAKGGSAVVAAGQICLGRDAWGVDLGILRVGSGSGRAKKSPVFFLAARARPDPVAGP